MKLGELVHWQWRGYARNHQTRFNLLLHIVLVPLFLAGNILLVIGAIRLSGGIALAGVVVTLVALALQGRGHRAEPNPPEPFTGVGNALSRVFLEQWVTFPRFVLSGGWVRAFRSAP